MNDPAAEDLVNDQVCCYCGNSDGTCPHAINVWNKIDCTNWFVAVLTREGCANIAVRIGKFDPVDVSKTKVSGETWIHPDDARLMAAGLIRAAELASFGHGGKLHD